MTARRKAQGHPGWGQLDLTQSRGHHAQLLRESLALAEEDAREVCAVGYAARLFAQLALPYRDPGPVVEWRRTNGAVSLRVNPGEVWTPGEPPRSGFPFGVVPRLLVTWMATEAVRTKQSVTL